MIQRLLNLRRVREGTVIGLLVALLVLTLRGVGVFTQARLQFTNVYFIEASASDQIVLVALDDDSLQRFGRTPAEWSRELFVNLLAELGAAQPRVIAFDLLLSEPTADDEKLLTALQSIRDMTTRPRIIFPVVGVPPANQSDDPRFPHAIRFANQLKPVASLADAVDYLGYVNTFPDADGTIRRQPTVVQVNDTVQPSFSVAVYLAYLRIPSSAWDQVVVAGDNVIQVTPQRTLHVDEFGFWQQNYFGPPVNINRQTFTVVSLIDVLDGKTPADFFTDKIVLVGLANSTGLTDQYTVPSASQGQLMSGVEIQANAVETLLQNRALYSLPSNVEALILTGLALTASLIYTGLRWYYKFAAYFLLLVAGIGVSFFLFAQYNIVISLFDVVLILTLPVVITLGQDTITEINRRVTVEFLLESVSQASRQRLEIDRILPLIAEDVQRILPQSSVYLWICPITSNTMQLAFQTDQQDVSRLLPLVEQGQKTKSADVQKSSMMVPFVWQQRVNGVLIVTHPQNTRFDTKAITLIKNMAQELAPVIDNALLYTETERQRVILETVVDESPNYVLVLDEHCHIQQMSRIVSVTFKVQSADYQGQDVATLLKAIGMRSEDENLIIHTLAAREHLMKQVNISDQSLILNMVPLQSLRWWIITLTDVSNLVRLNQLKTNMLRMLSHDLGNPLARILGYSSLLKSQPDGLSEMHLQFLTYIMDDGEEMNHIIEDVMQLEHLRSGEISVEQVDFREIVENVIRRFKSEIEINQQELIFETIDHKPVFMQGNYRQLIQMVSNLIGNAVKYTPDASCITVRLEEREQSLLLEVADTGYGIPVEAQPHVFNEFYRVRTEAMGSIKGHGLGLSLVKAIVDGHKGRVWLESEEGVGTNFYVELPTL